MSKESGNLEFRENGNAFIASVSGISSIKYVGGYTINGYLTFSFIKKPNFIHRFFSKLLLGWVWKDD
tara:strand:+ start:172 stop:372 length:201 start_codon:yes stop_codon:yes gene_type:complete